ncbi:MAG: hypothetical protein VX290_10795, partial [Candidatus Latescibacterota bacterium]|nr:hypothetical protein [Candidatus Latescibacterota bacterium]
SVFGVMRRRLPWLLMCLVGTLLSGGARARRSFADGHEFTGPVRSRHHGDGGATVTVGSLATGRLRPGK